MGPENPLCRIGPLTTITNFERYELCKYGFELKISLPSKKRICQILDQSPLIPTVNDETEKLSRVREKMNQGPYNTVNRGLIRVGCPTMRSIYEQE
jgi:hypothetical protein